MEKLVLWENLSNLKPVQIPNKAAVHNLIMAEDWAILLTQTGITQLSLHSSPSIVKSFNLKQVVIEMSCNRSMCLFLSDVGEIWAYGTDLEKSGVYGKKSVFSSETPVKLEAFTNSTIISISLGPTHAGAVCKIGKLYTWGTGLNGELGDLAVTVSKPELVASANIFKSKQVVCGKKYTAICTEAGFLYVYGQGKSCNICGGPNAFPYTLECLEKYFIEKAYPWGEAIVLTSDVNKCFVLTGCNCVQVLNSSEKVSQLAACSNGIVGLSLVQNVIYKWKRNGDEWDNEMFTIKTENSCRVVSGLAGSILIAAKTVPTLKFVMKEKGSKAKNNFVHETERKCFEEILHSYGVKSDLGRLDPEPLYNALGKSVKFCKGRVFKTLQNYAYSNFVYKKTYASMRVPIAIMKALQRFILLQKSDVFLIIKWFQKSKVEILGKVQVKLSRRIAKEAFATWKSLRKNKNNFVEKLKNIACHLICEQITKKLKKSAKFSFFHLKSSCQASLSKSLELSPDKSKGLIKLILTYSKIQFKNHYSVLSKSFKTFQVNFKEPASSKNKFVYIDPCYKIEIIPPGLENQSICSNEDSRILYNSLSIDSIRIHENAELLEPTSASLESTSPNSDPSPLVNISKDLNHFKAKINMKLPGKNNTDPKIPVGKTTKRNSFAVNATVQKEIRADLLKNQKKKLTAKQPSTPPIFMKKGSISLKKSSENLSISTEGKPVETLCKILVKVFVKRMGDAFRVVSCQGMQMNRLSLTPIVRYRSADSDLISDSWKVKLYSLGWNKFNQSLGKILKKKVRVAYNLLKQF